MIKSVGGCVGGKEPAWVVEYNLLGEIQKKERKLDKLKKRLAKIKKK